jgi:hypothetical protein
MRTAIILTFFLLAACGNPSVKQEPQLFISEADSAFYSSEGKRIATATFDTLSSVLGRQIAAMGPIGAVSFCNLEALNLTAVYSSDSISIRRVSGSYRNPANAPDSLEREAIRKFTLAVANGESVAPYLTLSSRFVHFYAPILLKPQCVLCHGGPNDIPAEVALRIDSLYPGDLARNYAPDDFRGMWHIKFVY